MLNNKADLRVKPDYLSADFFNLVKYQAIALGATNPVITEFNAKLIEVEQQLKSAKSQLERLTRDKQITVIDMEQQLNSVKSQLERLTQDKQSIVIDKDLAINNLVEEQKLLTKEIHDKDGSLDVLNEDIDKLRRELNDKKQKIQILNNENAELNTKLSMKTKQADELLKVLAAENNTHDNELAKKTTEIHDLLVEKDALTRDIVAKKHEVETIQQTEIVLGEELALRMQKFVDLQQDHANLRIDVLGKAKQIDTLLQEKSSLISDLDSKMKLIQTLQQDLSAANKDLEARSQQIQALQQDLSITNKDSEEKSKQIQTLQDERANNATKNDREKNSFRWKLHQQEIEIARLAQKNDANDQLIKALNSLDEFKCLNLINNNLIPLTQTYKKHLDNVISEFNSESDESELSASDTDMLSKVTTKHGLVTNLLTILNDVASNPLPSQRISNFTIELNRINNDVKEHRDPAWMRYCNECLLVIGIVCTGIIPGLIALLGYSIYSGKSPLFFSQSKGEQYIDQVKLVTAAPAA